MDQASQQPAELYVMYLELIRPLSDGTDRARLQYIVFPQMPARLAPGNSPTSENFVYFTRNQDSASRRTIWQYKHDDGTLQRKLPKMITAYEEAGWQPSPVVVCEIHPTELAQILTERKTPYRIMNRLNRVAKAMYRIDIS